MPPQSGRAVLRGALWTVRRPLAVALTAGLARQSVAVAVPYVAGRAVDDGVLGGDPVALGIWAGVLVALGLLAWAAGRGRHWWIDRSGLRARVWLRARLHRRIAELDGETAGRFGAGQLVARATADLHTIDSWVRGLATLVAATFALVAVTAALCTLGPVLGAVAVIEFWQLAALAAVVVGGGCSPCRGSSGPGSSPRSSSRCGSCSPRSPRWAGSTATPSRPGRTWPGSCS